MTTLETAIKDTGSKTIDPVCGMEVEPDKTEVVSAYNGHLYWFCAEVCRKAFEANPEKYLKHKHAKKKGWFGRYLERMGKINEKEFGSIGPRCCH
jgi:YHS domain-containing protein